MANIPGTPGKTKGTPTGPTKFELEVYVNRGEVAQFLRELAGEIEAGGPVAISRESWTLMVAPNEPFKLEVQHKFDRKELQFQLKLKENP